MLKTETRGGDTTAELARLKDDIHRVHARSVTGHNPAGAELRGLRIRVRTFLDQYRLTLPREDALELRHMLYELDQAIANVQ